MKKFIVALFAFIIYKSAISQNVGIGTSTPEATAILDLQSTSKGLLLPRMTTSQRDNIPSAAIGLMVFDTDKGTIYMFDGQKWLPLGVNNNSFYEQVRTAPSQVAKSGFGYRSCISGNYAAIAAVKAVAMGYGPYIDTVFVYQKVNGSWNFMSKLFASDGEGGDGFGYALAISGDQILVGAPYRDDAGAVYAFSRSGNTWIQTGILTPAVPQNNSLFGLAISMGGVYALIGAPGYINGGVARGAVYSFSRNISSWTQNQQFFGIAGLRGFGERIDVSGTYALIGAPGSDYNGMNGCGIAYFYRRTGTQWVASDTIYNPSPAANAKFGDAVAISESSDFAFVSRPNHNAWISNTGQVVVYHVDNPGVTQRGVLSFPNETTETAFEFGSSLSVYDDYLVVGAPSIANQEGSKGRVYIYKYDETITEFNKRWRAWRMIKDENHVSSQEYQDTYGLDVYINGGDLILSNAGANNFRGKVLFINIY